MPTIIKVLALWKEYGSVLETIGVDIRAILEYLHAHQNNPALTEEQKAEIVAIFAEDPRTIGIGSTPPIAPPPANEQGFPLADYNRLLTAMPDTAQLVGGDVVYRTPSAEFYVAMHGVGVQIPPEWIQVWPEVSEA